MFTGMEARLSRLRARATDELEQLRRRPWRAALIGLGLVALAVLGRLLMGDHIGLPYVTMYPAVVISAYIGGWRLGVATAVLCAAAAAWLFMPSGTPAGRLLPVDIAGIVAFLMTSAILVAVGDFAAHASLESLRLARQRQILLSELQHRIKNHLQLMGAMLAFHARAAANERIKARLEEAGQRLQVIAASYDNLYEPGARIDMRDHLRRLCDFVEKGIAANARIALEAADVRWSLDTVIPLSLIANELLTNAVKHLPEGKTLDVEVKLERAGEQMRLSVASNASTLPDGFNVDGSGLGLRLAGVLAKQLGGTLSAPQPPRALFIVDFPEPRAA